MSATPLTIQVQYIKDRNHTKQMEGNPNLRDMCHKSAYGHKENKNHLYPPQGRGRDQPVENLTQCFPNILLIDSFWC
jgi:hypothetical protein